MEMGHEFHRVTGTAREDCHWIGFRYRDANYGYHPEEGESWIGQTLDDDSYTLMCSEWFTDLWRTESRLWVSDIDGVIHMNSSIHKTNDVEWQAFDLGATITGLWGLRDDLVFAWGSRGDHPVAFFFNGSEWQEVDVPGVIYQIRGIGDDLVFGVGQNGLIVRWHGDGFKAISSPTGEHLMDVCVVSSDEMYACCGTGQVLVGTVNGFKELVNHDGYGTLQCITKWRENVWVGAATDGLFRIENNKLERVTANVKAESFDSRNNLLISTATMIVETANGEDFEADSVETFVDLCADVDPSWE